MAQGLPVLALVALFLSLLTLLLAFLTLFLAQLALFLAQLGFFPPLQAFLLTLLDFFQAFFAPFLQRGGGRNRLAQAAEATAE